MKNQELDNKGRLEEIVGVIRKKDFLKEVTPVKVRETLEELGPTFIKFGQIISSRENLLPIEYCQELTKLRGKVTPIDFSLIEEILKEEYGERYEDIFETIDGRCVGSASIAQVHKAILKTGEIVVLKVQKQDIKEKMASDIKLFRKAIMVLHFDKLFNKVLSLEALVDEFEKSISDEVDFGKEADNMERFRNNQLEIGYVRVPKVYKELSTSRVLVMEYVEGIGIDETIKLEREGYDLEEIAFKLADDYIKQAINDGFFQADPHQDNFLIVSGQIVYLDFGMMGSLSSYYQNILRECIKYIVLGDMYEVSNILIQLGQVKEINQREFVSDIERLFNKFAGCSLNNISFKDFLNDFYGLLRNYQIKLPNELVILFRGIVMIESVLRKLNPEISLFLVLESHMKDNWNLVIDREKLGKKLMDVYNTGNNLAKLPNELFRLVRSINAGDTKFNVEFRNSDKQVDKLEVMLHQVIICLLDVALILGASLIDGDGSLYLRNIYLGLAFILTVWLFIKLYIDHKTKGM